MSILAHYLKLSEKNFRTTEQTIRNIYSDEKKATSRKKFYLDRINLIKPLLFEGNIPEKSKKSTEEEIQENNKKF